MRIGSLFTGYGGLDMAVQQTLGGEVAWYSEIEPAACKVLAAHYPGVPNLGDITAVDWATVPPVDILTGGYPCQPFSHAGQRKGKNDERHLWPYVCAAIDALRPSLVVPENVRGHLTLGFGDVLADLSRVGYDATWGVVRASDAGAPHGRARIFIAAYPDSTGLEGHSGAAGAASTGRHRHPESSPVGPPADADSIGHERAGEARHGWTGPEDDRQSAADADRDGHGRELHARGVGSLEGSEEGDPSERQRARRESDSGSDIAPADAEGGRRGAGQGSAAASGGHEFSGIGDSRGMDWGKYEPAIRRWERLTRPAPDPTIPGANGRPRLSPRFVEWLMGLDDGHITGHGLRPAQELKMLGNGVVPQQAALALQMLGVAA